MPVADLVLAFLQPLENAVSEDVQIDTRMGHRRLTKTPTGEPTCPTNNALRIEASVGVAI